MVFVSALQQRKELIIILANDRKQQILGRLKTRQRAELDELVALTESSASTVRRDLNDLEKQHLICRVHGGAELPRDLSQELSIFEKSSKNTQAKEKIAKKAVRKVSEKDVIFLDAGTTTGAVIWELKRSGMAVTVVTNSPMHGVSLMADPLTIYILGGRVKKTTDSVVGGRALEELSDYRFNLAFIGANAYDEMRGAMTPDSEEAALKRLAIRQSDRSYLLIDRSKIGQTSFVKFAEPEDVEVITE